MNNCTLTKKLNTLNDLAPIPAVEEQLSFTNEKKNYWQVILKDTKIISNFHVPGELNRHLIAMFSLLRFSNGSTVLSSLSASRYLRSSNEEAPTLGSIK
jgi:hypothetical protein